MIERTLVLLKPDAMQRGIAGEVITRFERVGLKLIGMKMVWPDRDHYYHHYETIGKMVTRRGKEQFEVQVSLMEEGPVVAMVLEGIHAVRVVRKMVGETSTDNAAPGTIRGDYAHVSIEYANAENVAMPTIVHASGDVDEAKQEIKHWFKDDELFDWRTAHEHFTQPKQGK